MGAKRKTIVTDEPVLTDEQKEQCRKNALVWEMINRDLCSRIGIPFLSVNLKNDQRKVNNHEKKMDGTRRKLS